MKLAHGCPIFSVIKMLSELYHAMIFSLKNSTDKATAQDMYACMYVCYVCMYVRTYVRVYVCMYVLYICRIPAFYHHTSVDYFR